MISQGITVKLRRMVSLILALLLIPGAVWTGMPQKVHAAPKLAESVDLISASGYEKNVVRVRAKVLRKVNAKDGKYYLCNVRPKSLTRLNIVASLEKTTDVGQTLVYDLPLIDPKTQQTRRERALFKYAIFVMNSKGEYVRVSNARFVANPEQASMYRKGYYVPRTKKGIQTGIPNEAIVTKSSIAFCNLYVSEIVGWPNVPYVYKGKKYYFNDLNYYRWFAEECNKQGIQVTFQIMLDSLGRTRPLSVKGSKSPSGKQLAFNITKTEPRERIEAMFCYIAELFSTEDRLVSNWILGNEVEMCYDNYYMGHVSQSKFVDNYARTYRSLYNAVKSVRGSSKVYICMGQGWNLIEGGRTRFKSKRVVTSFAKKIRTLQPNVNWNLAQHSYPDLFYKPAFWKDRSYMATSSINSPKITMKNLHVLTNWVRKTYGRKTRVLVSEIGFDNSAGHKKAAAAMALAYDICACNPQVDGIMIRAYEDDPNDRLDGRYLRFGMKGRRMLKVYQGMDTTNWNSVTGSLLKKKVGKNWKKYVRYYNTRKLYTNYRN